MFLEDFIRFLKFESFISLDALIVFYYLGVVLIPILAIWFMVWIMRKFNANSEMVMQSANTVRAFVWSKLSLKHKMFLIIGSAASFLFIQLLWRMMFEFLVAYMQMHAVLVV